VKGATYDLHLETWVSDEVRGEDKCEQTRAEGEMEELRFSRRTSGREWRELRQRAPQKKNTTGLDGRLIVDGAESLS